MALKRFTLHSFPLLPETERKEIIKERYLEGEIRCFKCGRIHFLGKLGIGTNIRVQCHYSKCKFMNCILIT